MSQSFDLLISTDSTNSTVELRLRDANDVQLAYQPVDFNALPVSRRKAIFDLHGYLRHYIEPKDRAAEIAEVGVVIAEQILGKAIFERLWHPQSQRTLRIVLPGANGK